MKSLIETLIGNGSITGDLKVSWEAKYKEKKIMEALLKKAGEGDPDSAYKVYRGYKEGKNAFEKNEEVAFTWLKKSEKAGSVMGSASLGWALMNGEVGNCEIGKSECEGGFLLGVAAERGSDFAALKLGFAYAEGSNGFRVDREKAIQWFLKGLDGECSHKHTTHSFREKAEEKLKELMREVREVSNDLDQQVCEDFDYSYYSILSV